ncbi:TPA: hypothetical protein DIS55_03680, partial [Candidatus Kaiserbacteria bacterium]|nr:hypothetical protein [Candidatus Kaiserbacteria bacterium]
LYSQQGLSDESSEIKDGRTEMSFALIRNLGTLAPHEATHVTLCVITPTIIDGLIAGRTHGVLAGMVVGFGVLSVMLGSLALFLSGEKQPSPGEVTAFCWVVFIVAASFATAGVLAY